MFIGTLYYLVIYLLSKFRCKDRLYGFRRQLYQHRARYSANADARTCFRGKSQRDISSVRKDSPDIDWECTLIHEHHNLTAI